MITRLLKKYLIKLRRKTSKSFQSILEPFNAEIYTQSDPYFSSCFGFSLITKSIDLLSKLKVALQNNGFETRPIVTGNILRHPVSRYFPIDNPPMPNADKIHFQGTYISNYFPKNDNAEEVFSNTIKSLFL